MTRQRKGYQEAPAAGLDVYTPITINKEELKRAQESLVVRDMTEAERLHYGPPNPRPSNSGLHGGFPPRKGGKRG